MKKTVTKEIDIVVCDKCGQEITDERPTMPYIELRDIVALNQRTSIGQPYASITLGGGLRRPPQGSAICKTCLLKAFQTVLDNLYDPRTKE